MEDYPLQTPDTNTSIGIYLFLLSGLISATFIYRLTWPLIKSYGGIKRHRPSDQNRDRTVSSFSKPATKWLTREQFMLHKAQRKLAQK